MYSMNKPALAVQPSCVASLKFKLFSRFGVWELELAVTSLEAHWLVRVSQDTVI